MAGGHPRERVSLIVTILNEADTIDALLESIAAQSHRPEEIVVVDGGSSDGTWQRLHDWQSRLPLHVLRAPGANIAQGRNRGVRAAAHDIVAVTDAGVRLEPDWLAHLLAELEPGVDVVSGFFAADPRTVFERALGATVLPVLDDLEPATFLPSSRSVLFRRRAWESVAGYPEWLDYGEDLVFDLALKNDGCRFAFAPGAIAHFRPRPSIRPFFRQYFLYARGDGKANLWPRRHAARYASYVLGARLARLALSRTRTRRLLARLVLLVGVAAYTRRPYARLRPYLAGLGLADTVYALVLVPWIRLVGDLAKMLGYPVGVLWRLRTRWISRSSF